MVMLEKGEILILGEGGESSKKIVKWVVLIGLIALKKERLIT